MRITIGKILFGLCYGYLMGIITGSATASVVVLILSVYILSAVQITKLEVTKIKPEEKSDHVERNKRPNDPAE